MIAVSTAWNSRAAYSPSTMPGWVDLFRLRLVVGDDHRHAELGDAEQALGELLRQAHASVRGRVARQLPGMQRDARPGQPVHVRHRRVVVGRGMVVLVLLQDLEHAGRRCVAELAGRAGRGGDAHAVAVDVDPLIGERDDDEDRAARRAVGIPVELAVLELTRRTCRPAAANEGLNRKAAAAAATRPN